MLSRRKNKINYQTDSITILNKTKKLNKYYREENVPLEYSPILYNRIYFPISKLQIKTKKQKQNVRNDSIRF